MSICDFVVMSKFDHLPKNLAHNSNIEILSIVSNVNTLDFLEKLTGTNFSFLENFRCKIRVISKSKLSERIRKILVRLVSN